MLFKRIQSFIAQHNLIAPDSHILVGLSGGPDSVFLLLFLKELQSKGHIANLSAAHLDHEWRADSQNDVIFCRELTKKLGVPLVVQKMSEISPATKFDGSREAQGREARRHFLEQVRKTVHADVIALAHHLQDQEETFFIRLVRGTSLAGLTCMKPKSGYFIRPLLEVNKKDILSYLDTHAISYLIDPSNESPAFLRNRIRTTVLPALRACDERFDQNFLTTLHRLQHTEQFLEQLTTTSFEQVSAIIDGRSTVDLAQLFTHHPVMIQRMIMHWLIKEDVPFTPTEALLDEIVRFLQTPRGGTHTMHSTWQIIKQKGKAHIEHS